MKTICAYCGAIIKDGLEEVVSHGICKPCAEEVEKQIEAQEDEDEQARHKR